MNINVKHIASVLLLLSACVTGDSSTGRMSQPPQATPGGGGGQAQMQTLTPCSDELIGSYMQVSAWLRNAEVMEKAHSEKQNLLPNAKQLYKMTIDAAQRTLSDFGGEVCRGTASLSNLESMAPDRVVGIDDDNLERPVNIDDEMSALIEDLQENKLPAIDNAIAAI